MSDDGPRFDPHPVPVESRLIAASLERAGVRLSADDLRAAAAATLATSIAMTPAGQQEAARVVEQLHALADVLEPHEQRPARFVD